MERDNPALTSHDQGRNPLRVIIDPYLKTKSSSKVIRDKKAGTLIFTTPKASRAKIKVFRNKGIIVQVHKPVQGRLKTREILDFLSKLNVSHLFIEGGGETSWQFLKDRNVDEVMYFIAPKLLGGRNAPSPISGEGMSRMSQAIDLDSYSVMKSGGDILIKGYLN